MKRFLSVLVIIVSTTFVNAQESEQDSTQSHPKNVIYASVGSFGLWFTGFVNYERLIKTHHKKIHLKYYLRANGGAFATWGSNGPAGTLSLQVVFGEKNSHLETGLGITGLHDILSYDIEVSNANYFQEPPPTRWEYIYKYPAATIGYRYQKPKGGFIFRTGVAFPDGVYLSFGAAF